MHSKGICKDFKMKKLGEYYDLYNKAINTLLLDDEVENFRNMCLIYKLYSAKFLSAPGLAWQAALKKTKIKLDL